MTLCLFPQLNFAAPPLENASSTTSPTATPLQFNWFANEQTLTSADAGLHFIAASAKQGLAPEDYHFTQLQQLRLASKPQKRQRFNHLLTQSLLTLSHDLKVGKWLAIETEYQTIVHALARYQSYVEHGGR